MTLPSQGSIQYFIKVLIVIVINKGAIHAKDKLVAWVIIATAVIMAIAIAGLKMLTFLLSETNNYYVKSAILIWWIVFMKNLQFTN